MSDRRSIVLGALACVPVALSALAAGGMAIAGEQRVLAIEVALPGAVLMVGALVSLVAGALLFGRAAAARSRRRAAAAADAAGREAALHERERHQRFLARLDHELKNPLTAIRATAVAAPDGAESPAWRTVDAQAAKLSTLVRDLRKLADLEARPLDLELVDLEQVIAEAVADLRQRDPGAGARIDFTVTRVPWAVPPLAADVDLLSLAIDNVLGNAAKYSTAGPIEVRLREQDGWAVMDVADAGRGIPAGEVSQVFDELARAHNARDVTGSGIGLTLVATVMRQHGGDVSLRSVEGSGTLVTLRLPIRR